MIIKLKARIDLETSSLSLLLAWKQLLIFHYDVSNLIRWSPSSWLCFRVKRYVSKLKMSPNYISELNFYQYNIPLSYQNQEF